MDELFKSGRRLAFEIQQKLDALEYESEIDASLQSLSTVSSRMQQTFPSLPPSEMQVWRKKQNQLEDDLNSMSRSFKATCNRVRRKLAEVEERERLLTQRGRGPYTPVVVDNLYAERDSLHRSHAMTDEYIARGQATLESLHSQRSVLKRVQRRILDIGNSLGVSQGLLSTIERRTTVDYMILYAGCAIVVLLIIMLYIFWR